ncbi:MULTISPECIES: hypothetical protein [unclassified Microcoleus]|uniref:hypothetical protein n=1 Tax=unclassified Microcoleus TaxID=2642155 RepID=UPI002FD30236
MKNITFAPEAFEYFNKWAAEDNSRIFPKCDRFPNVAMRSPSQSDQSDFQA